MILNTLIAVIIGYLLGSIPFAYIAGRIRKGIDIRQVGGGNMGALNVVREIGPTIGWSVLVADVAKGTTAVLIAQWMGLSLTWVCAAGFAAVVGHNWPVFLGFTGGKGAATTMGVLLALVPAGVGISFAIIIVVVIITSNARLGILIGLTLLPLIVWLLDGSAILIIYSLMLPLFLGIRSLSELKKAAYHKKGLIFDREYNFWQTRRK